MALDLKLSNAAVNAEATALAPLFNNGYLRIYDGTKPAGPDTAISSQTLLAELRFAATAMASNSNGVMTFNALTGDSSANATGTATWYRAYQSDGTTPICDGTIGTSGCDMNLNAVGVTAGLAFDITSFQHTVTK